MAKATEVTRLGWQGALVSQEEAWVGHRQSEFQGHRAETGQSAGKSLASPRTVQEVTLAKPDN